MTLHSPNPARPLSPSQRAAVVVITLLLPAVALAAPWGYLVSADGKTRLPLDTSLVVVGTSPKAGAVISGSTVSKKHASISHKKGVVVVKDLRSTTGTLVAGTALRRGRTMQLFQRTKLTFGAETWTFEWGDRGKIIAPLRPSVQPNPKADPKAKSTQKRKMKGGKVRVRQAGAQKPPPTTTPKSK